MDQSTPKFKVAILGGGITGSALFYVLSKYTDLGSIALIEKSSQLGQINSKENNNSQTLHFGDIEANYSLEKAKTTKAASELVANYLKSLGETGKPIYKIAPKLLLAVGEQEVATFNQRFENFKGLFPDFKKLTREEIAQVEPNITKDRPAEEPIIAGYSETGFVVDFGKLAENFVEQIQAINNESSKVFLATEVQKITKQSGHYLIESNRGAIEAEVVVVSLCSHSLLFAKQLGYGQEFSILPVGGNFYTTSHQLLNYKVYTMQTASMPFAGVHGDPNLYSQSQTRFGPTANLMPFLERNNLKSFFEFISSSLNNFSSIKGLSKVISEKILFSFLTKSLIYEIPYFGPRAYLRLCRKIVPSLTYRDFKNGKTKAGIRPQLVDNQTGRFKMGEAEIIGDQIIFNISPSPGASVCLAKAVKDTQQIIKFFNGSFNFNQTKFEADFTDN